MDMCYDGALVMPSNYAVINEEEMTYVEGGGTIKLKFSRDFMRDSVTALTSALCSIIGGAIGTAVGPGLATIVGGAVGAAVGWIAGGSVSRACIKKGKTLPVFIPFVKSRTIVIP